MDPVAIVRPELPGLLGGDPRGGRPEAGGAVGDQELVVRETRTASEVAVSSLRRTTRAWTGLCGLGEDLAEDVVLAVDEAVSNVVEHAYPDEVGPVYLELTRCPGGELLTVVQDRGRWLPPSDPGFRGRGLLLIRRLADTASVMHTEVGTTVWMRWTSHL